MSTQPRLEARVSAQERRYITLDARVEELSEDMNAGFKQLSEDTTASIKQSSEDTAASIKQLSEDMAASFKQLSDYIYTVEDRFEKIEGELAAIRATVPTKDDLIATETRILEAFKQMLVMINPQNPPAS